MRHVNVNSETLLKLTQSEAWSMYVKGYTIYRSKGKIPPYLNKSTTGDKPWLTLEAEGYFDNKLPFFVKMNQIPFLDD